MLVEDVEEAYRPDSFCCAAKGPRKAEKEVHLPVLGREDRGAQWMGLRAPCRARCVSVFCYIHQSFSI